ARPAAIEDGEQLEADRKAVSTTIRLGAVSLPIVGFVLYLGTRNQPRTSEPRSAAVREAAAEDPVVTTSQPMSVRPADQGVVPASGLTMEIAPKAPCWVSVT